ncbi:peptidoglycan-binding domain-containing protein [Psychromonas sp. KJ10-10]|uniref:peptidoglycan-binding domain-containing protein n=1 Tax=Psychromonas sp. KJ10-10 TaxID=3391823 RepID=UPI0039B3FEE0
MRAVYKDVTSSEKVTDEKLKWAEVLCEDNMTTETIVEFQQRLTKAGVYNGPIDGIYGPLTERATNAYAKSKNLPTGSRLISLETAKHIGLDI